MAPDNLGMSAEGTTDALIKNIAGLVNYGKVLVTGGGHANAKVNRESRDEPLGDKFFMKTLGECHPIKVDDNSVPYTQFYNQDGIPLENTAQQSLCENRSDINNLEEGHTCDYIYYKHQTIQVKVVVEIVVKSRFPMKDKYMMKVCKLLIYLMKKKINKKDIYT